MSQPATVQSADDNNLGRYYHAPQVRLLIGDSGGGTEPIVLPPTSDANGVSHPVHADIEHAEVKQVHHGPSQVSIRLNNQRHEDTGKPKPVAPKWKYNAFDPLSFGQRMKVMFGYAIGTHQGGPANSQENLMLRARITDMTYDFPNTGGDKVTIKAEDALSLLNIRPSEDFPFDDKDEIEIVRQVLELSHSDLELVASPLENISGTIRRLTHTKQQTYYKFIEELANRLDYEIWMDIDDPKKLHFEKSRSLTLATCFDLVWGRDLLDFKPRFKGWNIHTRATTGGSNPRRRRAERVIVSASEISGDLHTAPGGLTPMTAIQARSNFFSNEGTPEHNSVSIPANNLDSRRLRQKGVAALRKSAREFLTAEATLVGSPNLRPGMHVNLSKLNVPFDGIYYITQATHTINNSGYKTKLSLRRTGMLDPRQYPHRQE